MWVSVVCLVRWNLFGPQAWQVCAVQAKQGFSVLVLRVSRDNGGVWAVVRVWVDEKGGWVVLRQGGLGGQPEPSDNTRTGGDHYR